MSRDVSEFESKDYEAIEAVLRSEFDLTFSSRVGTHTMRAIIGTVLEEATKRGFVVRRVKGGKRTVKLVRDDADNE